MTIFKQFFALFLLALAFRASAMLPAGLQSGDLVFRDGGEIVSELIKAFDNSGYSHVGMLYVTDAGVQVIHSTPAEHKNGNAVVIIDSLAFFQARAKNRQLFFYRVNATAQQHTAATHYALRQLGKPFGFNGQSLYCTQLIYRAWQHAGVNVMSGHRRVIPLLDIPVILPENIVKAKTIIAIPGTAGGGKLRQAFVTPPALNR